MRKVGILGLVIALIMAAACQSFNQNKEEKFVNPLFYETMYPISKIVWITKLTPNSRICVDGEDKQIATCKMLDNNYEYITLECTYFNPISHKNTTQIFQYIIRECNSNKEYCYGGKWEITEKVMSHYGDTQFASEGYLIIKEED